MILALTPKASPMSAGPSSLVDVYKRQILAWQDQNLGFLDANGFKAPLEINSSLIGESLVFSNEELEALEKGENDG